MDDARRHALARWLARELAATEVRIARFERLGGGAIQENWAVDLEVAGGERAGAHALVLRMSAPSEVAVSHDRLQEFAILARAHRAGVTCPEPWLSCADPAVLGRPFYLMRRVPGEARPTRLLRDPLVDANGDSLARRLGVELARLHRIRPPDPALGFLELPTGPVALARIATYRRLLDSIDAARPVLEWALRRLELAAPPAGELVLCHEDLRTGNFLVERGELAAVLDWEFALWGDRHEDLGWLLCRSWRFGRTQREVGGIGAREALYAGYEAESGVTIDRAVVTYWELMASVRWAVIALLQADRHLSGRECSLELALTAQLLPELERDILDQLGAWR